LLTFAVCVTLAAAIAGGCGPTEDASTSSTTTTQAGVSEAQLAELRSVPASEPMSGPKVPGIFTQADAEKITGLKNIKIIAQASPS
jgi:hypothetical protein